jgi:hypothetical protein
MKPEIGYILLLCNTSTEKFSSSYNLEVLAFGGRGMRFFRQREIVHSDKSPLTHPRLHKTASSTRIPLANLHNSRYIEENGQGKSR